MERSSFFSSLTLRKHWQVFQRFGLVFYSLCKKALCWRTRMVYTLFLEILLQKFPFRRPDDSEVRGFCLHIYIYISNITAICLLKSMLTNFKTLQGECQGVPKNIHQWMDSWIDLCFLHTQPVPQDKMFKSSQPQTFRMNGSKVMIYKEKTWKNTPRKWTAGTHKLVVCRCVSFSKMALSGFMLIVGCVYIYIYWSLHKPHKSW